MTNKYVKGFWVEGVHTFVALLLFDSQIETHSLGKAKLKVMFWCYCWDDFKIKQPQCQSVISIKICGCFYELKQINMRDNNASMLFVNYWGWNIYCLSSWWTLLAVGTNCTMFRILEKRFLVGVVSLETDTIMNEVAPWTKTRARGCYLYKDIPL